MSVYVPAPRRGHTPYACTVDITHDQAHDATTPDPDMCDGSSDAVARLWQFFHPVNALKVRSELVVPWQLPSSPNRSMIWRSRRWMHFQNKPALKQLQSWTRPVVQRQTRDPKLHWPSTRWRKRVRHKSRRQPQPRTAPSWRAWVGSPRCPPCSSTARLAMDSKVIIMHPVYFL